MEADALRQTQLAQADLRSKPGRILRWDRERMRPTALTSSHAYHQ